MCGGMFSEGVVERIKDAKGVREEMRKEERRARKRREMRERKKEERKE